MPWHRAESEREAHGPTIMGAAQSIAHVRNREARIRELESTVQELELQREEYRKLKIVADAEKKNLARQGLLVRENAARDRESKAIAGEQVFRVVFSCPS